MSPLRLVLVGLLLAARGAHACPKQPLITAHVVDPTLAATDTTPPSEVAITGLSVVQQDDLIDRNGCSAFGTLGIDVTAIDDQSTADHLGYEFEIVTGALPDPINLPEYALRPGPFEPEFLVFFGQSNQDFAAELRVTAIDEAGNRSAPSAPRRVAGTRHGCSTTATSFSTDAVTTAALLVLFAGWRARPRARRA